MSPDLSNADLLTAIVSLVVINLVLSGDNAVVIGLAAHRLPSAVRRRAIIWGSAGAIALRVVFTALAAYLLRVALLKLLGGIVLIWIAYRLLKPELLDRRFYLLRAFDSNLSFDDVVSFQRLEMKMVDFRL